MERKTGFIIGVLLISFLVVSTILPQMFDTGEVRESSHDVKILFESNYREDFNGTIRLECASIQVSEFWSSETMEYETYIEPDDDVATHVYYFFPTLTQATDFTFIYEMATGEVIGPLHTNSMLTTVLQNHNKTLTITIKPVRGY